MLDELEKRIVSLLDAVKALRRENSLLAEENERLKAERGTLTARIDAILKRLEGL
ncbi:hypothetical protein LPW11_12695 [Geomonas sp. RF6]|uniref:hypothetical protein n=1 Tax=Geomonas sp. RF6 TaxID=2897342 RepID=UPI001E3F53B9|nr:hypothetical protein [Geomonas sp. RF6]UFS68763.1 hypothetical protein LPW11_12695 [Geomonas sp. RF6]